MGRDEDGEQIIVMTSETQTELLRLIASENYAEFDRKLKEYFLECEACEPQTIGAVADFINSALINVKARRAHYEAQLEEIRAARIFFEPRPHSSRSGPGGLRLFLHRQHWFSEAAWERKTGCVKHGLR